MDAHIVEAACKAVERRGTAFSWGNDDCCTFVCDAVRDLTGKDLMASLRGKYFSFEAAHEAWGSEGFVACVQGLAKKAELPRVDFPFDGADLGLVATGNGPVLALFCVGAWYGRSKDGWFRLPRGSGFLAWSLK